MKNITLKMDEGVITRVRHVAVDEHKSVSAWVRDLIVGELDLRDRYEQDRKRALKALRGGFQLGGQALTRDEAHER